MPVVKPWQNPLEYVRLPWPEVVKRQDVLLEETRHQNARNADEEIRSFENQIKEICDALTLHWPVQRSIRFYTTSDPDFEIHLHFGPLVPAFTDKPMSYQRPTCQFRIQSKDIWMHTYKTNYIVHVLSEYLVLYSSRPVETFPW